MLIRYGKPSKNLMSLKTSFFDKNETLHKQIKKLNQLYAKMPLRKNCKNCGCSLSEDVLFRKQEIDYKLCEKCNHINGANSDNDEFCSAVYTEKGGEKYAKNYTTDDEKDYKHRVREIYLPKAVFLMDSLEEEKVAVDKLSFADLGAGSGYFIDALLQMGVKRPIGYEVSKFQSSFANKMIGDDCVYNHSIDETVNIVETLSANVVSMIGVLEHMQNPRQVLKALKKNKAVHYLYISVPTFSPTVFFETVFPKVFQRQLSGGHTHLYTEKSLSWMANEFGLEMISSWWFGTDIVDLYRNIIVELEMSAKTKKIAPIWTDQFMPLIDSMQKVIDEQRLSSEVHVLYRFVS